MAECCYGAQHNTFASSINPPTKSGYGQQWKRRPVLGAPAVTVSLSGNEDGRLNMFEAE